MGAAHSSAQRPPSPFTDTSGTQHNTTQHCTHTPVTCACPQPFAASHIDASHSALVRILVLSMCRFGQSSAAKGSSDGDPPDDEDDGGEEGDDDDQRDEDEDEGEQGRRRCG